MRTKTDLQTWIARHLPGGIDWLRIDPRVNNLLAGLGRVFARVDAAAETFAADSIPDQATGDRLVAWEDALNLPDEDYPATPDVASRQAAVKRALAQGARATPALYVSLATLWDVVASVSEPTDWPFHFWLIGPPEHVKVARAGVSKAGDKLKSTSTTWDHIERLVARFKPAHIQAHSADLYP